MYSVLSAGFWFNSGIQIVIVLDVRWINHEYIKKREENYAEKKDNIGYHRGRNERVTRIEHIYE